MEVCYDLDSSAVFMSDTRGGNQKQGQEAAAVAAALDVAFVRRLAADEARAGTSFDQLWTSLRPKSLRVVESSPVAWAALREELNRHEATGELPAVGIDCEGTHSVPPAVQLVACHPGAIAVAETPPPRPRTIVSAEALLHVVAL